MSRISRILLGVAASLAVVACLASTAAANWVDVADYQMASGAMTADSSGNGHTLGYWGDVTQSAPLGTGAIFNATSPTTNLSFLTSNLVPIDLTGYQQVAISVNVQSVTTGDLANYPILVNTGYGNSFNNANPGNMLIYLQAGGVFAGVSGPTGGSGNTYTGLTSVTGNYVFEYNLSGAPNSVGNTVSVTVIKDGVTLGTSAPAPLESFANFGNFFYIGDFNTGGMQFSGQLGSLDVAGNAAPVPEPCTLALLASGLLGLLAYAWKKRR